MKKNNIFLSLIFLGLFVFAACDSTDGELYQGEKDKVGFVAKATNLDMTGDYLKVPIGRTSTDGSLTVPVTLTALVNIGTKEEYELPGYTNAFKVAGDASFAPGEGKAYVNIDYSNFASVDPYTLTLTANGYDVDVSLGFPFQLHIQEDMLSPSKKGTASITGLSQLDFESAGTGRINGSWNGPIENVKYEKAVGVDAYKVIAPHSDYNIAFLIGSDGVTVNFPKQVIDTHPDYGLVSMEVASAEYNAAANAVVVTVSGYTVSAGTFGGGTEIFYLP